MSDEEYEYVLNSLDSGPLAWFNTPTMVVGMLLATFLWFLVSAGVILDNSLALAIAIVYGIVTASCVKLVYLAYERSPSEDDGWFTTPNMKAGIVVTTVLLTFSDLADPTTQFGGLAGFAGYVLGATVAVAIWFSIVKALYIGSARGVGRVRGALQ